MNPSFWKGKRVCITGLTGFKGAWLGLMLQELGAEVSGVSLEADPNSLFKILALDKKFSSRIQDIREHSAFNNTLSELSPDIVFHLAAQSLVRESYRHAPETFSTNIQGTVHVLEAVRLNPRIKSSVIITTDKCYENTGLGIAFRESDPLGGHDPYSASKAACEIVTNSYNRSFFSKSLQGVATARAGNVIGGGDFAKDRIIPDVVRAYSGRGTLLLRYPKSLRPWQLVLEPLSGYLVLAEKLYHQPQVYAGAWNFGPRKDVVYPVEKLVTEFSAYLGTEIPYKVSEELHPHEAPVLLLDCDKAKRHLSWEAILGFDETIRLTADWYRCYLQDPSQIWTFTQHQIRDYLALRTNYAVSGMSVATS